ncbi:MAG: acyltransferase [Alteromonadaceae bacterium]|nr:acyltransferase [Alteromonadaceae bacterium]
MFGKSIKNQLNDVFLVSHHKHNTIAPMEGLRGFAAFLVFVVHYAAQSQVWVDKTSFTADVIFYLRFLGATGVDLFFVISGFLIYGMLTKKSVKYRVYAYRRIKRIYPAFLAVMLLYLILSFLFPDESKIPNDFTDGTIYVVQCLLLLPGLFDIQPIMSVAWTLSYEMFFYLLVPVVLLVFNLRQWRMLHRVLFLAAIAIGLYTYNFYAELHIEMLMFISGMLLYEAYTKDIRLSWNKAHIVLPVTFGLMILSRYVFTTDYVLVVTGIMFFGYALVCLDVFRGESALARFFKRSGMRWYGNMSYSYYLLHGLTLKFLFLVLAYFLPPSKDDTWVFYIFCAPFFFFTLFTSSILFFVIEKPFSLKGKHR